MESRQVELQPTVSWKIEPFVEGDEAQLLSLFERTFGKNRSLEEWRWKFLESPGTIANLNIWVARLLDTGRIVGHYAGIPLRMQIARREVSAMLSVDTATDPDFRRQGMLTRFGETVYENWATRGQELVLGLPNQQWGSRKEALGWVPLFKLAWLRFPLRIEDIVVRQAGGLGVISRAARSPSRLASTLWLQRATRRARNASTHLDVEVKKYAGESGVFDRIWAFNSPTWDNLVVRDDAWVQWRYLTALPTSYDIEVAYRGDVPIGYIAYRIQGTRGHSNGYIADIFTPKGDTSVAAALAASALKSLWNSGATVALTLAVPGTQLHSALTQLGFFKSGEGAAFSYEVVPLDPQLDLALLRDKHRWHAAGGDSDVI
ncbi:MAG TPA: GNAT family N-acetyltransferase [Chloroflexia bacterium]|nr:GNAT family N-acetyltransferase [Chloroflexia bacterium]